MPVYNNTILIDQLQQQTEAFLNLAISELQNMPEKNLLSQPSQNKWSAAQCIEHLNSYGRYYLQAIEVAIENAARKGWSAKAEFKTGWLGHYFTEMMKPKEGKKLKKMAAPKDHTPLPDLNAYQVIAEFIDQQEKMLKLLEDAKGINLNKTTVAISIAKFIKLKLGDVFLFLAAHNERHILQAEKAFGNGKFEIGSIKSKKVEA